MILNNDLFNKFKHRVAMLEINGIITQDKESKIINHVEASIMQGDNELEHHSALSDDDLIK